jgi:hypothetical protein
MQIKRELKAPANKPAEPAEAAEPLDSEEEAETREAAVLEEMQVRLAELNQQHQQTTLQSSIRPALQY